MEKLNQAKKRKLYKYHNVYAHSNPLAGKLEYPLSPAHMNWHQVYHIKDNTIPLKVEFVDVGCGYGGFLVNYSQQFPSAYAVGFEIRKKVVDYFADKITRLRGEFPNQYCNIAVVKCNAMRSFHNFFAKGQLKTITFMFPDPHFKKAKKRRRIISPNLLDIYAYCMEIGGIAYHGTDVLDLHEWMDSCFASHPLFERLSNEEIRKDEIIPLMKTSDEAKKVQRSSGETYFSAFRRISSQFT